MEESVVMTGGSFTSTTPTDDTITSQPSGLKTNGSEKKEVWRRSVAKAAFDDTLIERDWKAPLCTCEQGQTSNASLACCWCYHKYMLAIRMGETPFMGLLPCATFGLRVKVRTQFGIKGSIVGDFLSTLFCEPCAVCQMTRELDNVGL